MRLFRFKKPKFLNVLFALQLSLLLVYFNANIVNVGELGTALPLLASFIGLSLCLFMLLWVRKSVYIRMHFVLFLLLIAWIATRIIIDLGDMEYLKQITIATTGGMLLFYLLGMFLGISYQNIVLTDRSPGVNKFAIYVFLLLMTWMLYSFSQRLHPRLFYLLDVDGSYQRPGNFLSIVFIIVSFTYFNFVLKRIGQAASTLRSVFWFALYTFSTFMALIGSQLFGSNSATAVILGVYLITLVMTLIIPRKEIWLSYLKQKLSLPWSKRLIKHLSLMAILGLTVFLSLVFLIVAITGFDITSMRVLGFGEGTNTSLLSRLDILLQSGANQMGYAPFFGNINVAYLTTGSSGRTLHTFIPYVIANLGLIGLTIVVALFSSVLVQLYRECRQVKGDGLYSYLINMTALYSFFVLFYILLFANLATGVSWAVLWFTLGFVSKPFGFKS